MLNCEDCYYFHMCDLQYRIEENQKCNHFKDKSLIIELTCKVGDTVYLIPTYNRKPYCGIVEDKVQMIGITSRGVHIKARNHHDHNKTYMLGKTAFLSRKDAEKALSKY